MQRTFKLANIKKKYTFHFLLFRVEISLLDLEIGICSVLLTSADLDVERVRNAFFNQTNTI